MSGSGSSHDEQGRAGGGFPTTRWSLVARAAQSGNGDGNGHGATPAAEHVRREALGHLLRQYLPALRAHLSGRRVPADRVDDLIQSFVADKVIERNLLAAADRTRGRFRAFLATALDHFAANQFRHDAAGKRAPQQAKLLAWDPEIGLEPAARDGGACDPFEVAWAREALAEAVRRARDECVATGRSDLWEVLAVRVLLPALHGTEPVPYGELVRRFGYATPKQAANALVTAKRRLEQALRSVLAEYVADEAELEQELTSLGRALAAAPHAWRHEDGNGAALDAASLRAAVAGPATAATPAGDA